MINHLESGSDPSERQDPNPSSFLTGSGSAALLTIPTPCRLDGATLYKKESCVSALSKFTRHYCAFYRIIEHGFGSGCLVGSEYGIRKSLEPVLVETSGYKLLSIYRSKLYQ